jgi:hypothetical protein
MRTAARRVRSDKGVLGAGGMRVEDVGGEWGGKIFCVNGQLSIIDPTRRPHDRTQAITRAALGLIKNSGTVLEVEESLYILIKKEKISMFMK